MMKGKQLGQQARWFPGLGEARHPAKWGAENCPDIELSRGKAQMRFEIGGSLIVFIWTRNRYREEVVRLCQGINRHAVRLLRARKIFGLCFLAVRRIAATAARP